MLLICVLRVTGTTSHYWEIAVLSLLPLALLPAWPVGVVAALRRRWALAGVCALIVAGWLTWVGPQDKPWSTAPAATSSARLRIFDANVSQDNADLRGIAAEIRTAQPTVVTLEEITTNAYQSLAATGVMHRFGYRLLRVENGAGGMGLWSMVPLTGATSWTNGAGTGQTELQATVTVGSQPVIINAVHVYAPVGAGQPTLWRKQLGRIADRTRAQARPLVVVGDLNATADHPELAAILHQGLSDSASLAGQGWRMTWPRNQAWVVPYLRIDHVLISRGVTVTGYRLGVGHGSDHRPLVVDLAPARS